MHTLKLDKQLFNYNLNDSSDLRFLHMVKYWNRLKNKDIKFWNNHLIYGADQVRPRAVWIYTFWKSTGTFSLLKQPNFIYNVHHATELSMSHVYLYFNIIHIGSIESAHFVRLLLHPNFLCAGLFKSLCLTNSTNISFEDTSRTVDWPSDLLLVRFRSPWDHICHVIQNIAVSRM